MRAQYKESQETYRIEKKDDDDRTRVVSSSSYFLLSVWLSRRSSSPIIRPDDALFALCTNLC